MKNLFWIAAFLSCYLHAATSPFKPGVWKLTDGGCSNTAYVLTADEKAFWDAVKSGDSLDQYTFSDATHGVYDVKMAFAPGGSCLGKTPFEVSYIGDGEVEFLFGETKWTTAVENSNITVNCGDNGEKTQKSRYKWQSENLVFLSEQGGSCGEFSMRWVKQ